MADLKQAGLWINGEEVPAANGEYFQVIDPGNGKVIGRAARGRSEDVDRAVSAARTALHSKAWQGLNPYERGYLMLAWAQKIKRK